MNIRSLLKAHPESQATPSIAGLIPQAEASLAHPEPASVAPRGRFARFSSVSLTLVLTGLALLLTACGQDIYKIPEFNFAGRPTPPSGLQQRVLVSVTSNGSSGSLVILDGLRDLRNNVQNTITGFGISGFSGGDPTTILSFPEELRGYILSATSPYSVTAVNYGTEATSGAVSGPNGPSSQVAIAPDFARIYSAQEQSGQLLVVDQLAGGTYFLNLPNVYRVSVNRGDTVALAMTRDSNLLYRVVKLNPNSLAPPGAIDCEPNILPVYCVLPVPGTFDRPYDVVYSLDGSSAYVLNCGVECGGGANGGSGVSFIPQGALQINAIPTSLPYPAVVTNTVPIPGGVTAGLADGTNLYLSGQQLQPDGLFAGNLTLLNLTTLVPSAPISISDGLHTRMIFADEGLPSVGSTLWIGSQFCANGERAARGLNYNCLTRVVLNGTTNPPANIVPAIAANANGIQSVPYPNEDNNLLYYGSLTGICWVQNLGKVYTAFGGQVHAFNTSDGSEINNVNITVQGTALDVAYIDALTNSAN